MSSLPSVLEDTWNLAQPKIFEIRAALSTRSSECPRIIRVGQLDSELLDQELAQLLQEPIKKALSLISTSFRAHLEPELGLFIQLTLYKLSIWNTGASYGAKLQDLRYVVQNATSKRLSPSGLPRSTLLIHGTLTLLLPYIHNRFRSHALSHAWPDTPSSDYRRKVWNLLGTTESLHALLGLANFIGFLWNGKYRTLADRILGMSLVSSRRLTKRDVSYEFMNRQMVWHAFTEFLLFLLPLINGRTIRRRLNRIISLPGTPSLYSSPLLKKFLWFSPDNKITITGQRKRGKFWSLSEDQCAICAEDAQFSLNVSDPTNMFVSLASGPSNNIEESSESDSLAHPIFNPYQTSCGHIYCYHCVAERIIRTADEAADEGWECLRCGEEVKEAHRFTVDVTESEHSESDYDFSSDLDIGTDLSGSMGSYSESGFSE